MKKHLRVATAAFAASAFLLAGCNGDDVIDDLPGVDENGDLDDDLGDEDDA